MGIWCLIRIKNADVGQVTKAFLVIHPVADHEMVGYGERDIVGVDLLQAPRRLIQAGCDLQGFGFVLLQQFAQKNQGQARIQDVFDQDHVSPPDRSVQILNQSYRAAGLYPLVARNGYEIERGLDRNTPGQVGKKDGRPLQHAYQQNSLSSKVVAYLRADFRHAGGDLLAPEQHVVLVLSHWLCHSSTDPCQEKAPGYTVKTDARMYPFIHVGHFSIGTFGLCLWLASVCACWTLYRNFLRFGIDADAVGVAAYTTVGGVVGAKLWHVLEDPTLLMHQPLAVLFDRAGFAWFGGLLAGIAVLLWQGRQAKINGLGMLDLAAPAVSVGYGVGRLGCLISGDGDYGKPTHLPWGMSFPNGLVPTTQRVHPTPIYEMLVALMIAAFLWRRGKPGGSLPLGRLTGEYLVLSGVARFLVEFIRINPPIYWGLTNAQVASLGSIVAGILLIVWARRHSATTPAPAAEVVPIEAAFRQ
jgi:phosphatidylglycerol---prolipoprotein diacylglyceryl transferase